MKIAMLAPPWIKIPPAGYGGIEWVVYYVTNELVIRGHEVTLFATGDSTTNADLACSFPKEMPNRIGETMLEVQHAANCIERADEFDIIQDHTGFSVVAYASLVRTPIVHTLHGPFTPETCSFYRDFKRSAWYVAISDYQRSCCPGLQYAGTVYNPLDINGWPFVPASEKEDYLLAFGRICADKGFHTAIEVAKRTGMRLIMAGALQPANRDYYETVIKPQIDGDQIQYVGETSLSEKWKLFSRARAFLFPIQWPEPFGIVMTEAMATGTPVIAFPEGSVPEVVEDGVTGFTVKTVDEMIEAVGRLDEIDAETCREHVQNKFSVAKCTDRYEQVYETVLESCRSC